MELPIDHKKSFQELKESLTTFQKSLHFPEEDEKGVDPDKNLILTVFYNSYRRATWYYRFPSPLVKNGCDPKEEYYEFKYKINPLFHGLIGSDLSVDLPSISCNEGYEARWTHNVGSNVVVSAKFVHNDDNVQCYHQVWGDIYNQRFYEDDPEVLEDNLGNGHILQEWSHELPKLSTSFTIPWFYTEKKTDFYPLYFCSFLDEIYHNVIIRRNIDDLLEIRHVDSKEPASFDEAIAAVNGKRVSNRFIPNPVYWGDYMYLSDMECAYNRCERMSESSSIPPNVIYIDDVQILKSEEDEKTGSKSTVVIPISDSEFPVHSIHWVARNLEALDNGKYSNYSNNAEDARAGWSPFKHATLKLGPGSYIFKKMPSWRTERVYPVKYNGKKPRAPGFNSWFMGVGDINKSPQPGVVIKGGHLEMVLNDAGPYAGDEATDNEYQVFVALCQTKCITFDRAAPDEESRQSGKTRIVISGNV